MTTNTSSNIRVRRGQGRRFWVTHNGQLFNSAQDRNQRLFAVSIDNEPKTKNGAIFVTIEDAPFEVSVRGKQSRYHAGFERAMSVNARRKTKLRQMDAVNGTWVLSLGNTGQVLCLTVEGEDVSIAQTVPAAVEQAQEVERKFDPTDWWRQPRQTTLARGFTDH